MTFKLGMAVICISHAHADDLFLDARSQWLSSPEEKNQRGIILTTKQAMNIKLAATVGHTQ